MCATRQVTTQEESLVLMALVGEPMQRPGRRELSDAARRAWKSAGLGRQAANLVRTSYWVETGGPSSVVDLEDGRRGLVEFVPPPSTRPPPFDASDTAEVLRVGSSACEWMAGAGPPHGCPEDEGCDADASEEEKPIGRPPWIC